MQHRIREKILRPIRAGVEDTCPRLRSLRVTYDVICVTELDSFTEQR
jgi:hypothetical protein